MAFKTRLFLESKIDKNQSIHLSPSHIHFLFTVLRVRSNDKITIFNGISGEWEASLIELSKNLGVLRVESQLRTPKQERGPWVAFAPVKKSRTNFLVEKATELGAEKLIPVKTKYTEQKRLNTKRLTLVAKEASEQCGRLTIPKVQEMCTFGELLENWPNRKLLIFGDESGRGAALKTLIEKYNFSTRQFCGFFIGPEGGFSGSERLVLGKTAFAEGADFGPRILRSETAVVAALSAWHALTC